MGSTTPDGIVYPDGTTKVGPLKTAFSTLASSVQAALTGLRGSVQDWIDDEYALPTPQTSESSTSPLFITATVFTDVTSINPITLTLPRPAWVQCALSAWVSNASGDVRAGITLSGATVVAANQPAWGSVLYQSGVNYSSLAATKTILCGAGTTTFKTQAYQNGGGATAHGLNYALMQIVPVRWADAAELE